jgi:type III pantothenate kinase
MLLVIDLGNTNLTMGLFDSDQLGARWRLATDHERMPDEYGLQSSGCYNMLAFHPSSWKASACLRSCRS